jgi:hypothetical protein
MFPATRRLIPSETIKEGLPVLRDGSGGLGPAFTFRTLLLYLTNAPPPSTLAPEEKDEFLKI